MNIWLYKNWEKWNNEYKNEKSNNNKEEKWNKINKTRFKINIKYNHQNINQRKINKDIK